LSVVFMVIGHWELIVELKWENKNSNAGNSFVRLLVVIQACHHFDRCLLVLDLFKASTCVVMCLFHILEVTTALVDLHTDMFLCFDDVTRVGYERNL
jgi:hypothetical protein